MPIYQFKQVDVFTARPFYGNPVAVVLDADDLDPAQMQRIAAWTNLSETTFVLRPTTPEADYRLRIFTAVDELPFAGHPSLGTAHAVLESGRLPPDTAAMKQECSAGVLPLRLEGSGAGRRIFVRVPEAKILAEPNGETARALAAALGTEAGNGSALLLIDVGPRWLVVNLGSGEAVQRLQPDMAAVTRLSRALQATGITVFGLQAGSGASVRVRSFAPAFNMPEDPVCGSGNATVAAYLNRTGLLRQTGACYEASQGTELGRDGHVSVRVQDEGRWIEIGGPAVTVVDGQIAV